MMKTFSLSGAREALPVTRRHPLFGCVGIVASSLMPDRFGSCHMATTDGYVLEGHVPALEVKRLLAAKPNVIGWAVPSMPPQSPGMEMGSREDPYQLLLIDRTGHNTVFASYPQ